MRTLNARKQSLGPSTTVNSNQKLKLFEANDEAVKDYATAFHKKASLPNPAIHHSRAKSTNLQQYTSAGNQAARPLMTAEPATRADIRFKKVGNLMTME